MQRRVFHRILMGATFGKIYETVCKYVVMGYVLGLIWLGFIYKVYYIISETYLD